MTRHWISSLALALALTAPGAAPMLVIDAAQQASPATPEKPPPTGTLKGRVLRADGRPLPRATVRIRAAAGTRSRSGVLETELDGTFLFDELPPGEYRLSASKTGFISLEFGQRRPREPGRPLLVEAGRTIDRLDIALPRPSAITGRIVDNDGEPVERVLVQALRLEFAAGRRRLLPVGTPRLTNDLGRYRLHGLQPGRYFVSAVAGHVGAIGLPGYAPTYYPGTVRGPDASMIAVELSQDTPGIDFALEPARTARIAGKAVTSGGEPITGGIMLTGSQRAGNLTLPVGARIRPDGTFEFANVAPGDYVVQVSRGRKNGSTEGEFAMQYVALNGEDVTNLSLRTLPGATVTGRITTGGSSLPSRDVSLTAMPVDFDRSPFIGGPPARAEVNRDGTFTMAGLSGVRLLTLDRAPEGWALKGIYVDGNDITDTPIDFDTRPRGLAGLDVVLTNQITDLVGGVVDAANQRAGDYAVVVFSTDRSRWTLRSRFVALARPQEDDTFRLRGLPPDEYYVAALSWIDGSEWQDPALLDSLAPRAARVTIAEGQSASLIATLIAR